MRKILVTGVAGFIGSSVADALISRGDFVVGVDNLNEYYDVNLKKARLEHFFKGKRNFKFIKADFSDLKSMKKIFKAYKFDSICHLGGQAGVRYSLENPYAYISSNVMGTTIIFELAKEYGVKNVVYASSSSIYGNNKKIPFSETDKVDMPISLYAATKRSDELIAYTYHHLYGIKMTGLRFFTVYGPWGRPDMALYIFTKKIIEGQPIDVFNNGKMKRDFTYIDDIRNGTIAAIDRQYDYEIFNLSYGKSQELMPFIKTIEKSLGKKAKINYTPIQPGDVPETFGDIEKSRKLLDYNPSVEIQEGVSNFVAWYKKYFNVEVK